MFIDFAIVFHFAPLQCIAGGNFYAISTGRVRPRLHFPVVKTKGMLPLRRFTIAQYKRATSHTGALRGENCDTDLLWSFYRREPTPPGKNITTQM